MQGQKLDINIVITEYRERLNEEISKNIMMSAYIKQLEAQISELQSQEKTEEQ